MIENKSFDIVPELCWWVCYSNKKKIEANLKVNKEIVTLQSKFNKILQMLLNDLKIQTVS